MKKSFVYISLIASLLIAVHTEWSGPSKILVICTALTLLISDIRELAVLLSSRDRNVIGDIVIDR